MQSNLINLFNGIIKKEINVFYDDSATTNNTTITSDVEMNGGGDDEESNEQQTKTTATTPITTTATPITTTTTTTTNDTTSQNIDNINSDNGKPLFDKDKLIKEIKKIYPFFDNTNSEPIQIELKSAVDINIRIFFNDLIKQKETTYQIIDLTIKLAYMFVNLGILDSILPLQLSEDLFETKTISECLNLFGLLESRSEIFSKDPEIIKGRKRNLLLKICIELLKRFSRSTNPDHCGRILLFLAYVFPLSDPSGLNIKGEHNVHPEESLDFQNDIMENVAGANGVVVDEVINNENTVDRNFYRQFWGLQIFFQNPQQILLNMTTTPPQLNKLKWESFIQSLELVIGSFSTHINLDDLSTSTLSPSLSEKHYFTKYLTSSNLMKLQLKDSTFRRNILTQILITFQNLDLTNQKYLIFNDLQKNIIQDLTIKCFKILSNTQPNGEYFSNCLSSILKREKNWILWKRDGCKAFERPACSPIVKKKKTFKKSQLTKVSLGNPELSRLWNLSGAPSDNSYLKTQNTVSLDTFIKPLKKEAIEQAEKEYQEKKKLERRRANEIKRAKAAKAHRKEYDDKKAEFLLSDPTKKDKDYPEYEELPAEVDSDDLSDFDEPKELLRDNPVYVWKTLRLICRKRIDLFKSHKFDDILKSFIKPTQTVSNASISSPPSTTNESTLTSPTTETTKTTYIKTTASPILSSTIETIKTSPSPSSSEIINTPMEQ